jgi:hypothetical protein
MKKIAGMSIAIWIAILSVAIGDDQAPKQISLSCDIGPISKTCGKSQWLVYSCNDAHSIVIVAAPGNAAVPFYFMFWWNGSSHQLRGEGTGDTKATDAACADIKKLTEPDIALFLQETETH